MVDDGVFFVFVYLYE